VCRSWSSTTCFFRLPRGQSKRSACTAFCVMAQTPRATVRSSPPSRHISCVVWFGRKRRSVSRTLWTLAKLIPAENKLPDERDPSLVARGYLFVLSRCIGSGAVASRTSLVGCPSEFAMVRPNTTVPFRASDPQRLALEPGALSDCHALRGTIDVKRAAAAQANLQAAGHLASPLHADAANRCRARSSRQDS
jgi:hypothetical protein